MGKDKYSQVRHPSETARWVLMPLMLLLMLGISSIAGLMFYSSQTVDNSKRDDLLRRVAIALEVEAQNLDHIVEEYTFWDEAYEKLVVSPSVFFAEDHLGAWMYEFQYVAISLAVDTNGEQTMGHLKGQLHNFDLPALTVAGLGDAVVQDKRENNLAKGVTGFLKYKGGVYQFAVNQFMADTESETSDGSFLVLARQVDDRFIEDLASRYELSGLRLSGRPIEADNMKLDVSGRNGEVLATLTWNDPAVHGVIGVTEISVLLALLGSMALLALFVARREIAAQHHYQKRLTEMAFKDPLTGVSNRRDFMERSRRETTRSERFQHSMSILMMDIDQFKSVNDQHGHNEGDIVLVEFARCITDGVRDHDLVARMGGEEFAVLMPHSDVDEALQAAERLRESVAQLRYQGVPICQSITVSIGVAERQAGEDLTQLIVRADQALYAAKDAGRNRCVVAGSEIKRKRASLEIVT